MSRRAWPSKKGSNKEKRTSCLEPTKKDEDEDEYTHAKPKPKAQTSCIEPRDDDEPISSDSDSETGGHHGRAREIDAARIQEVVIKKTYNKRDNIEDSTTFKKDEDEDEKPAKKKGIFNTDGKGKVQGAKSHWDDCIFCKKAKKEEEEQNAKPRRRW